MQDNQIGKDIFKFNNYKCKFWREINLFYEEGEQHEQANCSFIIQTRINSIEVINLSS